MSDKPTKSALATTGKYVLTGLLTVMPIWVTWLIVTFILDLLSQAGAPLVKWLAKSFQPNIPWLAKLLQSTWFQSILAVVMIITILYILGWLATKVFGRKMIKWFDSLMQRIPLVKTIYGSVKTLLMSMQQKPEGVQRVVLIDFPSPEMKSVGLVTRTLIDEDTGKTLAAVYVPTTPNPTSGYLEIVPLDKVTPTTWSVDEAMAFIVSGGTVAPRTMHYSKGAPPEK
jgi:uncharacterized membrane protein